MKVQKMKWINNMFVEEEKKWKYSIKNEHGIQSLNLFLKSCFIIPLDVLNFWNEVEFDKCEVSDDILANRFGNHNQ